MDLLENAYRDTGKDEGATVVLQLDNKLGWFWYIPLHDNRVSIVLSRHSITFSKAVAITRPSTTKN